MLALAGALAFLSVAQGPSQTEPVRVPSLTGRIEDVAEFESKALGNKRNLHVYLPPGYEANPRRKYPVLYVHDGQNVFNGATSYLPNKEWRLDETAEALIGAGLIEPLIIVGIDNAGIERANEYLPTRFKPRWSDSEMGGKADLYGKMLVEEIKPFIDRRYRTRSDARSTGLMGSSFGGVVTYYLGITHPNVFSRLGVVSPSVWVDDYLLVKKTHALKGKLPLKIWLDMGTQEGPEATKDAQTLKRALNLKGWRDGKDLAYYEEGFAQHNEDAWARRSPAILMFLFGR
ncbi:MAG TPA: alpha/beta hydrolase-fold protein [Fimbriimonas sp.]